MQYILPMQGMLRKRISRHEWLCAIGFFSLYLYIHSSIILRFGMDPDEMLDFNGSEMASHVYLGFGRWGLVAWGKLVGSGFLPVSGGVTAGLILAIAYLFQCRLLFLRSLKDKLFYGIVSLACFQFYSVQVYSMQVEGFALGILLVTISCAVLMDSCIKVGWRIMLGMLLLFGSLSFYQTCGLCFVVLYGMALIARNRQGEEFHLMKQGITAVLVCAGALLAFMGTKMALLHSGFLNSEAMDFCHEHEDWWLKRGFFASENLVLWSLRRYVEYIKDIILSCNGYIAFLWLACMVVLFVRISRNALGMKLIGILCVCSFIPLFISAVYFCWDARSYLYLPFLEAGTCTLALQGIKLPRWGNMLLALFLALSCIKASHSVSKMAARERAIFEAKDMEHKLQYTEARRYALSRGIDPNEVRILVVEKGWNRLAPDFYAQYPIYPNFHLATWRDREKHADIIQQMPTWPAEGSIAESQGEIIIKAQGR